MLQTQCLICGNHTLSPFYKVNNVPVHSCKLEASKEKALNTQTSNILLSFCEECGFISNTKFNQSVMDYSSIYEDQQCFSPTFNKYAEKLAKHLISKYNLYNKEILEIGCGKGDFLQLLCELGHSSGIGIDPAIALDRLNPDLTDKITFIKDYYSDLYSNYHGDLICCRHTFEHIPNVAEFLQIIRHSIKDTIDAVIVFEVPDVTRILREVAFWDIYHEHCSYFNTGTLARLFRACKFDICDIKRVFGDQYILLEAKPVKDASNSIHLLEESIIDIKNHVEYFSNNYHEKISSWKKFLKQIETDEKRLAIWGSGSKCVSFLTTLKVENLVDYVIDINPYREGKFLPHTGHKIMSPEYLKTYKPDVTLVMNPIYEEEIKQMLYKMDVSTEVISIE